MNHKNSKPFKTLNQQLKILRERGLSVPSGAKTKRSLEQFGIILLLMDISGFFYNATLMEKL